MNIKIRNALVGDCEKIRPLQKEIAELHFNYRPDLFKFAPHGFTKEEFKEKINDSKNRIYVAITECDDVVGYVFARIISIRNHSNYNDFD